MFIFGRWSTRQEAQGRNALGTMPTFKCHDLCLKCGAVTGHCGANATQAAA